MIDVGDALFLGTIAVLIGGILAAKAGQLYERRRWERRLVERAGLSFDTAIPPAGQRLVEATAAPSDTRFERLEQAVDAIAVEMERIGEGQRFVTKLLAERKKAPGEITPRSPVPGTVRSPA